MTKLALILLALAPACALETGETTDNLNGNDGPPDARVHWARDAKPGGASGSPLLVYHGGTVMSAGAAVQPIFWGTSWSNATFVGDKITGLQSFYSGMGGTSYDKTNSEYTDASGAHVGSGVSLGATLVDTSAAARCSASASTTRSSCACRQSCAGSS